jgi:SAM-dependent methyltransferase
MHTSVVPPIGAQQHKTLFKVSDKWNDANLYESYVGRWSRLVGSKFIGWINQNDNLTWLDVGCGTGALTNTILKLKRPEKVIGIDPSESHIQYVKEYFKISDRASFVVSDATKLPLQNNSIDVVVSGLVLNFIGDIKKAITEFKRVCRNNGMVCGYVWDYGDKMEMMRYFWDAAISLSEAALEKDEAVRFPICDTDRLTQLFQSEGLCDIETSLIDVPTVFADFDDFWKPFLSGQAPAPGHCMSLSEEARQKLKQKVFESLPVENDGSIHLIARAIAIKAIAVKE